MTMHAVKDLVTLYTASTYRFFCPACLAKQVQTEIVLIYPLQPKACHICGALFQMIPPVVVEITEHKPHARYSAYDIDKMLNKE